MTLSRIAIRLAVPVALVVFAACGVPQDQTPEDILAAQDELRAAGLVYSISADRTSFAAADVASVTVTLTNTGNKAVSLVKYFAPGEDLDDGMFTVAKDGAPVAYLGAIYKRAPAMAGDLLSLVPGAKLSGTVDLATQYDLSQTGVYAVRLDTVVPDLFGTGSNKTTRIASNELVLKIDGRASGAARPGPSPSYASITYTGGCTTTQQSTLVSAVNQATTYASGALSYLNGAPSATPRYVTWFGAFSTSGWNTADTHFASITDAFQNKPLGLDCKCRKNYYAYVYPTQPYVIYVCSVFWTAPMAGTDSKGGTLIHEMSHFNVTASTNDYVYGQTAAKSLAISNPTQALGNADNHEYFAENNPFQQ